ncbi:hypothetical protein ASF94_02005 [Acidovorax sp. Leaf160]|nr:hypothetical protein ASF94_02005 [Acidovorax sp. Leaf160]
MATVLASGLPMRMLVVSQPASSRVAAQAVASRVSRALPDEGRAQKRADDADEADEMDEAGSEVDVMESGRR